MVDDDRLRAALGLRPLARVVDDERVDVRERAERRLRVARGGEGEGFAGKPFEVPVLAHVHDRVHPRPLPEPRVEGEVAVGGYQVGVVIGGGGVDVVAPRGLKPDRDVAEADRWYGEARTGAFAFALPCPGQEVGVTLGRPPSFAHGPANLRGKRSEEREVVVEGKPLPDLAPRHPRVCRPGRDRGDEGVAARRDAVHGVTRGGHRVQELDGARRGVEPDPVAEPAVPVRVVREHDGDPPLGGRGGGEVDPRPREIRGERHPVATRDVGHDRAFGKRVEPGLRLERHRAGEDPPVHLGERDVHRDVARGEPLRPAFPVFLAPAREHHLEHRPAARIEGGRAPLRGARRRDREPGGVQHEAHPCVREHGGDEVRGDRVLEARNVERERIHAARPEGVHEGVDGSEVRGLDVGAVEDDGRGGGTVDPPGGHLVEAARPALRMVEAGPGERRGLPPLGRMPDEVGREGEEVPGVRGPAVHAVLPQPMDALRGHRAEGGELGVRLVVARKEGERSRPGPARLDELLHPVGPVAGAAQHPGDDELRTRDHRLDVEVHRHRVGELHEVREAEGREVVAEAGSRAREARELGVRGGEEDDVARGLAEVDRLRLVDRRSRLRAQQVHRRSRPAPPVPRLSPPGALPGCGARRGPFPDHHEPRPALLAVPPLAVVVVADALADALHEEAHVLARDRREALDAEDPVRGDGPGDPAREGVRAVHLAELHAERGEVVVIVLPRLVEVGGARIEVVLRRGLEPEKHGRVHRPLARDDSLDGRAEHRPDLVADPAHLLPVDEVGLVQHDEIRAPELLLEELLERTLVVEGVVGLALRLDRGGVGGEEPRRVRGGIDDRDDSVHRHPGAHARPAERLDEGLGEREPGGLDDDVVGRKVAVEEGLDGGEEVVRHRAADAAVRELEDVFLLAALDPAPFHDLRVDPDVAELVDDEGEAPAVRVGEEVADEARLARAEEAGDHGGGDPLGHGRSSVVIVMVRTGSGLSRVRAPSGPGGAPR